MIINTKCIGQMITSFKCKETEKIWNGIVSRRIPRDILKRALNTLYRLHTSITLDDLKTPPSNHLEKLKGDRLGQYSIRVNQQYRICFVWTEEGNACDVELIDYH